MDDALVEFERDLHQAPGCVEPNTRNMHTSTRRHLIISACFALGVSATAFGQPYWVRHVGSLGNDHISDVKTDADGYIYITGEFSGTADFEEQTLY